MEEEQESGINDEGQQESEFPIEQENTEEIVEESPDDAIAEGEADTSDEAHEESSEKPKRKNRVSGKTRINQLYREKSQAEYEAAQLRAEVARLQQLSEVTNKAAMTHYDRTIDLQLERAKQMKMDALQSNDIDAQIEADVLIARTTAQKEAMEAYKAQNNVARQPTQDYQAPQQQYQPQTQQLNETTERWLQENTWFIPGSEDHDPEMQEEVQAYADALDRKLRRTGQSSKIMTQEYFDTINDYIAREFYAEEPAPRQQRNLTMRQASTRAPVAPVSRIGSANSSQPKGQRVVLTAEQKDFARQAGISQESYIKHLIETNKVLKDKGRL